MTDRYVTFTVMLDKPTRDDDAEPILAAIRMIKGVAKVVPEVADPMVEWAKDAARRELIRELWEVLK